MNHIILRGYLGLAALLIVVVGGCAANPAAPRSVEEPTRDLETTQPQFDTAGATGAATEVTGANKAAPGIVVQIDPTTGEFLPGPVGTPAPAVKAAIPNFFEVSSPTPGGGVMIDLKGQFQTPLVATMDAEGKITLKHEATMPAKTTIE